eukprot:gene11159-biopygen2641
MRRAATVTTVAVVLFGLSGVVVDSLRAGEGRNPCKRRRERHSFRLRGWWEDNSKPSEACIPKQQPSHQQRQSSHPTHIENQRRQRGTKANKRVAHNSCGEGPAHNLLTKGDGGW